MNTAGGQRRSAAGADTVTEQVDDKRRRATLSDVAAHAGVSAVTVSRVLRKPEMVSTDLRQRVEKAVGELAYVPNQLASALASARTGTIGVVVPSFTNGVFGDYLRGIHDILVPAGFQVLVLNSRYLKGAEERAIATLVGQHPEAMILAGIDQTETARRHLRQTGVPVVQTMELADDPIDINIGLSQRAAGYAATRHLIDLGHRDVVHVAGPNEWFDARSRIVGWRDEMLEAGLPVPPMIAGGWDPVHGYEIARRLVAERRLPTAIFAANDPMALGMLRAFHEAGVRVPDDVSLVGFDDVEGADYYEPPLTTVRQPFGAVGLRSIQVLLAALEGAPASRTLIAPELVVRASTGVIVVG